MPDVALTSLPEKPELRAALEARAKEFQPPLRVIATEVLGNEGEIDIVALAPDGGVVLLFIGAENDDRALLTEAMAQRIWVRDRLDSWRQLAPELGLRVDKPIHIALFCASYCAQTLAACSDELLRSVELFIVRAVDVGGRVETLIESVQGSVRSESPDAGRTQSQDWGFNSVWLAV